MAYTALGAGEGTTIGSLFFFFGAVISHEYRWLMIIAGIVFLVVGGYIWYAMRKQIKAREQQLRDAEQRGWEWR